MSQRRVSTIGEVWRLSQNFETQGTQGTRGPHGFSKLAVNLDTYASTTLYQHPLFSVQRLAPGPHTLSIEVPHIRDASTSGSWIWINAFDIENGAGLTGGIAATDGRAEQSNPALNYNGTWFLNANLEHSGGSAV